MTRLAPAWSPDGRKIAFGGDGEIYVMNADGRGLRRLTRNPASDGSPAWSPDGRRIAFGSERDGNLEVYVMNTDGSGQRNLTRSPWNEGSSCLVARAEEVALRSAPPVSSPRSSIGVEVRPSSPGVHGGVHHTTRSRHLRHT